MPLRGLAVAVVACCGLAAPSRAEAPLPFKIGGAFSLTDQTGSTRTDDSLRGMPSLLFFGYATCDSICSVALPRMAEAVDLLDEAGREVRPILITVDPERDTPDALAVAAPAIHPRLLALTGSEDALAKARTAFRVESKVIGESLEGPIYAHGSFIYLIGSDGEVLTLLPPILGPERIAEIASGYLE